MAKYKVEITETFCKSVDIDAESFSEAENKVRKLYDNNKIELKKEDLLCTSFTGLYSFGIGKNEEHNLNNQHNKEFITYEKLREQIISEYEKEQRKRYSEKIKESIKLKKQKLGIDVDKKDQEMER